MPAHTCKLKVKLLGLISKLIAFTLFSILIGQPYLLVLEAMTPAPPVEALWRRLCRLVEGPPRAVACRSASVAVHLSSCANSWYNSIFKYRDRSAGLDLMT